MTTTVLIAHKGPAHHDITITVVNPQTGATIGKEVVAKAGEFKEILVYDTQGINIRETPNK